MPNQNTTTPWVNDLLGYEKLGQTFTKLIQTVDDSKVISIEAGFGHGKTFFRTAWAEHLRQVGEVVIEIDAQRSDHSGDPVVTFLGALLAALPPQDEGKAQKAGEIGKKYAAVAARSFARVVLKSGAEEIIDLATGEAAEAFEGQAFLQETVKGVGQEMSKTAAHLIASQLAAENAIQQELPEQLDALRGELTNGKGTDRVIILIDELDRCHPEYAISLLETMKHVFDRTGFVFCLLVNADYLEKVAQHRFGSYGNGERYLDKFVDLRLSLGASDEAKGAATKRLAMNLPLGVSYGADPAFSVEAAAELAGKIAASSSLSFRQIKRVLDRIELALRCYAEMPLDCSLFVYLGFSEAGVKFHKDLLPRAALTPRESEKLANASDQFGNNHKAARYIRERCPEFFGLDEIIYKLKPLSEGREYHDWYNVLIGLGPRYIPEHEAVLNAAHDLLAPEAD